MRSLLDGTASRYLEALLDVTTRQHTVAAANIANVDTPGYRARALDFRDVFQSALSEKIGPAMKRTRAGHLPGRSSRLTTSLHEIQGLPVRNDGNNVSVDQAMLELVQAAGRYRAAIDLLRQQSRLIAYSISEGRRG
ncbi:MAG: flagellar basal body rod protein FlgB [Acidobacteriota bacterium]